MAAGTHLRYHLIPDAAEEAVHLLTVGLAHLRVDEGFHGTLKRTHLEDLHLHAHLLHEVCEEHRHRRQAVPVNDTFRVHDHLIRHGSEIVGRLRVDVAIGENPFAALLILNESLTKFLQHGGRSAAKACAHFHVDAFHLIIGGGFLHSCEELIKAERFILFTHEHRQRIRLFGAFLNGAVQVDTQYRALTNTRCLPLADRHADERDEHHHTRQQRPQADAHDCGKYELKKLFHT